MVYKLYIRMKIKEESVKENMYPTPIPTPWP